MPEIKIVIDEARFEAIGNAFDFLERDKMAELVNDFYSLAGEILFDWISGNKRYRSLTEQYLEWVEKIYTELMPAGSRPSSDFLYNNLNIAPGQAAYLSRVLSEKNLALWRTSAITELKECINEKLRIAQELVNKGDRSVKITITLGKIAALELKRVSLRIWSINHSFTPPIVKNSFADIHTVEITAESLVEINTKIN